MKRLSLLLLVMLLCTATVFASENPVFVADNAEILADWDEEALAETLGDIWQDQGIYVAVWTDKTPDDYNNDFFGGDQDDHIVLLVCPDTRDWEVFTGGEGNAIITDSRLEDMAEEFVPLLSDGDYADAFALFAEQCRDAIDIHRYGEPFEFFPILLGSVILGLIIALIVTGVMRRKLRSVRSQRAAANYIRPGSMHLTQSADLYLYSHVTVVKKPEPSNTNRSFSGTSYGGRGGKF